MSPFKCNQNESVEQRSSCNSSSFSPFFSCRKVTIMEDPDQNVHLKNLSLQQANNEEEALNLLFLGDTNRMIAEVGTAATSVTCYNSYKHLHKRYYFGNPQR